MPTFDTALVYPGGCLIEGTNLSEGRGTTRPFENWGAPWLDVERLFARVVELLRETRRDSGLIPRPNPFRPTFHKYAGRLCFGVQPHVVDRRTFRPVAVYTVFLAAARQIGGESFEWRTEPYEFVSDPIAIDLLFGSGTERILVDSEASGESLAHLFDEVWRADEEEFRLRREPYLLYR